MGVRRYPKSLVRGRRIRAYGPFRLYEQLVVYADGTEGKLPLYEITLEQGATDELHLTLTREPRDDLSVVVETVERWLREQERIRTQLARELDQLRQADLLGQLDAELAESVPDPIEQERGHHYSARERAAELQAVLDRVGHEHSLVTTALSQLKDMFDGLSSDDESGTLR